MTAHFNIKVCGRSWILERPSDLESMWESMTDFNDDERLPYWTEVWPASIVLCKWLEQNRSKIQNNVCMDVGCGIGLTALVGQWLGANVVAMDYEPEALKYGKQNAVHNNVPSPRWAAMDWRRPAFMRHGAAFVWGGDIMYEQRFAVPILNFFDHVLALGGVAWIAEPSRTIYDTFRHALRSRRWTGRCVFEAETQALYAQEKPVPIRIWEIER